MATGGRVAAAAAACCGGGAAGGAAWAPTPAVRAPERLPAGKTPAAAAAGAAAPCCAPWFCAAWTCAAAGCCWAPGGCIGPLPACRPALGPAPAGAADGCSRWPPSALPPSQAAAVASAYISVALRCRSWRPEGAETNPQNGLYESASMHLKQAWRKQAPSRMPACRCGRYRRLNDNPQTYNGYTS